MSMPLAASFVAGMVAAWLVPDRTRGVVGLVLGIVGAYAVWGTNEVIKRINACGDSCGGLRARQALRRGS